MAGLSVPSPFLLTLALLLLFLLIYISPLNQNHLTLHFSPSRTAPSPTLTYPQTSHKTPAQLSAAPSPAEAESFPDSPPFSTSTDNPSSNIPLSRNNIKKRSRTEKIEEDLARARAAIRNAIRLQNYTSDREETYIPSGCVYRNAYAFHQLCF